jgi:esterase/lipase superfamily enzyme
MELLAYGQSGFPVVVFPTSGGRFFEYEDRGMVNSLHPKIDRGELQVICVDSVDQESWYNRWAQPADRLNRQNAFDAYLVHELAPVGRRWEPPAAVSAAITPSTSRCAIPTW